MFGLFGKIIAHEGQREGLLEHLLHAANLLREVQTCDLYVVGRDETDPHAVWVLEVWQSREDHQASLSLAAIQALIAAARPLIAGMGERFEFTPLGGKGLAGPQPETV